MTMIRRMKLRKEAGQRITSVRCVWCTLIQVVLCKILVNHWVLMQLKVNLCFFFCVIPSFEPRFFVCKIKIRLLLYFFDASRNICTWQRPFTSESKKRQGKEWSHYKQMLRMMLPISQKLQAETNTYSRSPGGVYTNPSKISKNKYNEEKLPLD